MKSFDSVIDRLTHRLDADMDLRAEISNELRGHLEESATSFISAGLTDEEANNQAIAALGDQEELANGLWQANKRRLRGRTLVRWIAGVALLPGAGAIALSITWSVVVSIAIALAALLSLGRVHLGGYKIGWGMEGAIHSLAQRQTEQKLANLSDPARRLFESTQGDTAAQLEQAQRLALSNPSNRIYRAHYALALAGAGVWSMEPDRNWMVDSTKLDHLMEVLDAGARLEPDNGFYPLLKATMLMNAGAKYVEESETEVHYLDQNGKSRSMRVGGWQGSESPLYQKGLSLLPQVIGSKYISSHSTEFEAARLAALPRPKNLGDEIWRSVLPGRNEALGDIGQFASFLAGEVLHQARAGQIQNALHLIQIEKEIALKMTMGTSEVVVWYNSLWNYEQALAQQVVVGQIAHDSSEQAKAMDRIAGLEKAFNRGGLTQVMVTQAAQHAGWLDSYFVMRMTDPRMLDLRPEREAEYALFDQLALAGWIVLLLGIVCWQGASALACRFHAGRWPGMLQISGMRLASVLAIGILPPLLLYGIYAYVFDVGRTWSISLSSDRLAVEYAAVGAAMAIGLRLAWQSAARRRAREIGIDSAIHALRLTWMNRCVGAAILIAVIAFEMIWHHQMDNTLSLQSPTHGWGFLLAAAVASYGCCWLWPSRRPTGFQPYAGPLALFILIGAAAWLLSWDFSYLVFEQISHTTALLLGAIALGTFLIAAYRVAMRLPVSLPTFLPGLSMATLNLAAAVLLSLLVGLPLYWKERSAVQAMAATGADYRQAHDSTGRINPQMLQLMLDWQHSDQPTQSHPAHAISPATL